MSFGSLFSMALAVTPMPGNATFAALAAEYPIRFALNDGARVVDRVLDSALYARLERDGILGSALGAPDAKRGITALRFLAGALDTDLRGMATKLLDETIAVYLDPTAPGRSEGNPRLLVIADLGDDATAARWLEVFDQAAILVGATDDAITEGEVRSIDGKEFHAAAGRWIVAANDREALELARAALADQDMSLARDGTPRLSFEIDVARLRADRPERDDPRRENGLGALLGFGLEAAAAAATRLEGSIALLDHALAARVELFHPPLDASDPALAWYCAASGEAPPPLRPDGFVASLRVDRDFAAFYRAKDSWLAKESENAFLQFDSGMNLFFGGRSFADEILPALGAGATLLVTRRDFSDLPSAPAIRLPSFTLVAGVDPERLSEPELATAFQNTLAIINLDRAGKGGDSLLAGSSRVGEITLYEARFLPQKRPEGPLDLRFNFAPALAIANDHLVIGSARDGVAKTVSALAAGDARRAARAALTELEIDLAAAGATLGDNRDALVDDRMLKEGEDRETASRAIDSFLALLAGCGRLNAALALEDDRHALDLSLTFPPETRR